MPIAQDRSGSSQHIFFMAVWAALGGGTEPQQSLIMPKKMGGTKADSLIRPKEKKF